VLQVQRLDEKELALLDNALCLSLDEFLVAKVLQDMCGAPYADTCLYELLYHEFKEAIAALREGEL
jgi:hypothetical protein